MKTKLAVIVMLALFAFGVAAWAADYIFLNPENYGTLFPLYGMDQDEMTLFGGRYRAFDISPDGQWIAYEGYVTNELYIRPVQGGVSRLLYTWTQVPDYVPPYGTHPNTIYAISFKPDGSEVTFVQSYYDPEMNSTLTIQAGGFSGHNTCFAIKSVNVSTGECSVIGTGNSPRWDPTGRYLVFTNYDHRSYIDVMLAENDKTLMVLDTMTGERTPIRQYQYDSAISGDGQYIIFPISAYSAGQEGLNTGTQFYRVPITGGVREQITFSDDNLWGNAVDLLMSRDGQWLFYSKCWGIPADVSLTSDSGSQRWHSSSTYSLNVLNLTTGVETELIPRSDNLHVIPVTLSGDGTQLYVWVLDHLGTSGTIHKFWRCTFDPENLTLIGSQPLPVAEEIAPAAFPTVANYPNPFNPATTIAFTLPEAGRAELQVFNIMGQRVRTLVSAELPAGAHEVVWDGRDDTGMPVSSGVFVTRLRSGELVVSNRMTLVK